MPFQRQKNLLGWIAFSISLLVYVLTIEPTTSLWDCSEFLVSAYKLQICHAPGAPLFLLLGRVFSLLSFGNVEYVAVMINLVSAVASAATVMFLFWIAVWLTEKVTGEQRLAVLLSAFIGALAFAFTDSFWFSAVEAEVYALSALFMAAVLWAATKWEREADRDGANRWILLIFFLTGLSIGVHLLNLLVLPTVGLIIYFKKRKPTLMGGLAVLAASGVFVLVLMKVFIPGVFSLAGPLELLDVNQLGLPVNSGFYAYLLIWIVALTAGLVYSHRKQLPKLNFALLALVFLMLGYTTYLVPFIRSAANPPVDQGNPETTFELINYLKRENYGSRPLLYGETFGSVPESYVERKSYRYDGEGYVPIRLNPKVLFAEGTTSLLPRMNSREPEHMKAYASWVNMKGKKVGYQTKEGRSEETTIPTLGENLSYFWNYQLGHMYWRYLMWNFVGRQNDIQGMGGPENGNWLSGIDWLDRARLGDVAEWPSELRHNFGYNRYFFLPFLLGLIGLIFQYRRGKQGFWSLLVLFGIMSVGLVFYINEIPVTPRERDYVFVGSFFVFALWIAFGALALFDWLKNFSTPRIALVFTGVLAGLAGPGILLHQNYDDHDRSDRYSARELARNYLMCCEPNAILFTRADNDTYPLWYCQEVEGIRQDVRIVVMPYLNASWYLPQINQKIYDNEGVLLTIPVKKYAEGDLDYLPVVPKLDRKPDLKEVLQFVASDSSKTTVSLQTGEKMKFVPVNQMYLNLNGKSIPIELENNYIMRNELAFWDILNSNANERPICFTAYSDAQAYGLADYLRYDGLVYRLVSEPQKSESPLERGQVDTERLFENLMNQCRWESLKDRSVYFDWHHRRLFASAQIRPAFYRLAKALVQTKQFERAQLVLQEAKKVMPFRNWPLDYYSVMMSELYFEIGNGTQGEQQLVYLSENLDEWINYYLNLEDLTGKVSLNELEKQLFYYQKLAAIADANKLELADLLNDKLGGYLKMLNS